MAKHWYNNGIIQVFREESPDSSFMLGMLESSKQKMREHEFSEEHKRHISEANRRRVPKSGYHWSDEAKQRQSERMKTLYDSGKIQVWNKGVSADNDLRVRNNADKSSKTKIERYGSAFPNNNMDENHKRKISDALKGKPSALKGKKLPEEVGKKISKAKMGHTVSEETRRKLSISKTGRKVPKDKLEIILTKQYITKKKNNSFNISEPEEKLYNELLEANKTKTILRQYRDKERYPYYCDFYIVEDDLFIELNAHWTHGEKPFDKDDPECQQRLLEWEEKAKTSEFYRNAITTWTKRDVEKAKCAKEHNLNYKVIY